jgi:hypothetical protein
MTFYSYPGKRNHDNTKAIRPSVADMAAANTNFTEFRKRRDENPQTTIGMEDGELCQRNGTPAQLMHEEYNQHTNEVVQVIRENSQVGSGTVETTWSPDGPKRMKVTKQRNIHS